MTAQRERLLANHERIRAGSRRLLAHMTRANDGDLIAALELSRDLTEVVKGLDAEDGAAELGEPLAGALAGVRRKVRFAADALSYVFSVPVILECVASITRLLDDVEHELPGPAETSSAATLAVAP